MLKNRLITALILGPLILAAIYFLPATGIAILWGALILAAAWEWTHLAGLVNVAGRVAFVAAIFAGMLAARAFAGYWAPGELPQWFYGPVVAWWIVWGIAFRMAPERLVKTAYPIGAKLAAGAFVLLSSWILLSWLRLNFGQNQILYLVLLIWLADVAAYFVGKRFGHTKLAEPISPGKTVEGVYGALFAAALFALAVGLLSDFKSIVITDFVFLSLITVGVSIVGDLFESLAKRIRGVKDSGNLLPGHGGLLDRIDSLVAAVSVFYVGSLLLEIFVGLAATTAEPIIIEPESHMEGAPAGAGEVHEDEPPPESTPEESDVTSEPAEAAPTPEAPN